MKLSFIASEELVKKGYLTKEKQAEGIKNGDITSPPKYEFAPEPVKRAYEALQLAIEENRKDWEANLPNGSTLGKVTLNISK
jgi:hypothetical protein